jgi:hypothetical protein
MCMTASVRRERINSKNYLRAGDHGAGGCLDMVQMGVCAIVRVVVDQ